MKVNISVLKANLSKYLRAAQAGKTVIITDRDIPIAKVVPFAEPTGASQALTMIAPTKEKLSALHWPTIHVAGAMQRFIDARE